MTADRERAARVQALYVRLLFCDETYDRYRKDPSGLAAAFDLEVSALDDLPKADALQLIAERKGRRIGALNEIQAVFGQSYGLLEKRPDYRIEDFLSSDAFSTRGRVYRIPMVPGRATKTHRNFTSGCGKRFPVGRDPTICRPK